MVILSTLVVLVLLGLYGRDLIKNRMNTKQIVVIAMMAALSCVLSFFKIVSLPQDGGITLFSMLPIMLVGVLYGRTAGVTCGLVTGVISLINGVYIVHPIQFFLDYLLGSMALGLAGVFGSDNKVKLLFGGLFASGLCVLSYFTSGVVFFAEFAPEGMNPYVYSFVYNFFSAGVEGIVTSFVLLFIPLKQLAKQLKIGKENKYSIGL